MWLANIMICLTIGLSKRTTNGQFAGPNIALGKPAKQSPGDYCVNKVCYDASLAVDGQVDLTGPLEGHCTHTNEQYTSNASWSVDFGQPYILTGIRIYNRKSVGNIIIGNRLRDFKLYGILNGMTTGVLYTYNYTFTDENYPVIIQIPLPAVPYVSGIKIEIPQRAPPEGTYLALCEVEVFSDLKCPEIQTDSNTKVQYTNSFNHGSKATFSCNEGYYITDNKYLDCVGFIWNKEPPVCQKVFCVIPSNEPNSRYEADLACLSEKISDNLPFNCSLQIICDIGYYLLQEDKRYCLATGSWSQQTLVCRLTNCTLPISTLNGLYVFENGSSIVNDFVYYGTRIRLQCNKGFKITTGNATRSCEVGNRFSGQTPGCSIVTCQHPGQIVNGKYYHENDTIYSEGKKSYSETIKVVCAKGFMSKAGANVLTCNENGTWDDVKADCVVVICLPLDVKSDIQYNYSNSDYANMYGFNSTVNISCIKGLVMKGSPVRRCNENGIWDGEPAVCDQAEQKLINTAAVIGGATSGTIALLMILATLFLILWKRDLILNKHSSKEDTYTDLQCRGNTSYLPHGEYEDLQDGFNSSPTLKESRYQNLVDKDEPLQEAYYNVAFEKKSVMPEATVHLKLEAVYSNRISETAVENNSV